MKTYVRPYPDMRQRWDGVMEPQHRIRYFMDARDVRRAFEIWGCLSHADVMRGLALKERMRQHVSGVIGALHHDCAERVQTPRGEKWRITDPAGIWHAWRHPGLSPEAIAAARSRARQMAEERSTSK